jgi:hypothetical protein
MTLDLTLVLRLIFTKCLKAVSSPQPKSITLDKNEICYVFSFTVY